MRRFSLAFRVVALVAVLTVSVVGQSQVVEPEHTQGELTLADAARTNNYPLFESLYAEANDARAFAELHRFWKWSLEDRLGGFYGEERHARFARDYPAYADYIAEFAIVDSNGNTFFPSAETRRFLLQQAMKGNVPRKPAPVKVAGKPAKKVAKPVETPAAVAPPPVAEPVVTAPAVMPKPAPAVVQTPVVRPRPRIAEAPKGAEARRSTQPEPRGNSLAPAIALLIAGLIGAGLLTLMLRTPPEEAPKEEEPMEPLRIIPLEEKPKKTA